MTKADATPTKKKFSLPKIPWRHPVTITVLVLLAIFAIYGAKTVAFIVQMVTAVRPPAVVSTAVATRENWPQTISVVTSLQSKNGVVLKNEVSGTVSSIKVTAGQMVAQDDILIEISPQSEAAKERLAKLTLDRQRDLRDQKVNTQADLDQAQAAYDEAKAELDKKVIRAPFAGRVGIPEVYPGQYLPVGTTLIALESIDEIHADFGVPQRQVGLLKIGAPVNLTVDAYPGQTFQGSVQGIDPRLSQTTRNLSARAVFANPDGALLTNMFGTLEVILGQNEELITVPSTAIVYSAVGNYVYLVRLEENTKTKAKEKIARQTFVKLGRAVGDKVAIVDGLNVGDEVVVAGQLKLQNGSPVAIDNSSVPTATKTPKPTES